jgi:N utilization substance protein A
MLNDVLDLERDDIARLPGMTPEATDQLMAFLSELTDEESSEEAPSNA